MMDIALLFNSDHPSLGGWYGGSVLRRVLATGVLQTSVRHMRVSLGDVCTYGSRRTVGELIDFCKAVYTPASFDCLIKDRLEATHARNTIYCWVFRNMDGDLALRFNDKLSSDPSYLGLMDVDLYTPYHLSLFKLSLIERYRLRGKRCSMLYSMSENEDADTAQKIIFEEHGFTVCHEDIGARGSIFDNYDTLAHAKRVGLFKKFFSELNCVSDDDASELTMLIEELHPKMFDAFAAAARSLRDAETDEDLAQSALSGRRLLEATADYLYPPGDALENGRKVGRTEYRNRLWAFIQKATIARDDAKEILVTLGKEVDRLDKVFNAGLHSTPNRTNIEQAFKALITLLGQILNLSPEAAKKPYLAYSDAIEAFFKETIENGT